MRSTGLYTLAMVSQRAASILLLPLYTRYLSRSDYGVMELLDLVPNIAGLLVGLRLSQALFYFYHHAPSEIERRGYVTTAFAGAAAIGVVVAALGAALAPQIGSLVLGSPRYADLVRLTFLGFAGSLPVEVGFAHLRVHDRAGTFAAVSLWRLALSVLLNVLLLTVFGMGVSAMLWSSAISTACLAAWFARDIFRSAAPAPSTSLLAQMTRYSAPLAVAAVAEFILHFGDRLFLRDAVPLADLGLYGLAYKLGMIVPFITTPFFVYWNAQMVGIVAKTGGDRVYARMATYLLLILTTVTLALTVFARPVVLVLADSEFREAAAFIPWIAAAYLVRGMGSYWSNTFLLNKRSGLVMITMWTGCIACLLGCATLIPAYGLWGAVAATLLGFSVMAAFAFFKSQQVRPFDYEYGRWTKVVLCAVVSAVPSVILHPSGFRMQVALGVAAMVSFPLSLYLIRFPTPRERQVTFDSLRRLFRSQPQVPGPVRDAIR